MLARTLSLVFLISVLGCGDSDPATDAAVLDSSVELPDRGPRPDAPLTPDSGVEAGAVDANVVDGGRRMDLGTAPDAGVDRDAGADIDSGPPASDAVELISDRHFARGFIVKDPTTGAASGMIQPGFAAGAPIWSLGQWGSHSSLGTATAETLASGAVRWADRYGSVTIGRPGTEEADLALYVDANAEYAGVYRRPDATVTWPHLLGEQRISPPGTAGPGCPPLTELRSLDFSAGARLLRDDRHLGAGHNAGRHAAQYLIYFTVQNLRSPDAAGYGDYLWFGLTLYDDRRDVPPLAVSGDDGTGKLIYNIGLGPLTAGSLSDGSWHSLEEDLLPHILLALEAAWDRGYLPDSHNIADYRIGGMNLGWEIPGLNSSELQLRDFSLAYTTSVVVPSGTIRYDFNSDGNTEGWGTANVVDINGGPVDGRWALRVDGSDPSLTGPTVRLDAADYNTLSVTMANDHNPAAGSRMQVFWATAGSPGFSEARSTWVDVDNGGGWLTYDIDLSALAAWSGTITQLRIDPIMYGDGHQIGIDAIVLQ